MCIFEQNGKLLNEVHRQPTKLHLMWINDTKLVTASPEKPGTVTILSYWWVGWTVCWLHSGISTVRPQVPASHGKYMYNHAPTLAESFFMSSNLFGELTRCSSSRYDLWACKVLFLTLYMYMYFTRSLKDVTPVGGCEHWHIHKCLFLYDVNIVTRLNLLVPEWSYWFMMLNRKYIQFIYILLSVVAYK